MNHSKQPEDTGRQTTDQQHPDQQHPDQQHPDQQNPDQQNPDQQNQSGGGQTKGNMNDSIQPEPATSAVTLHSGMATAGATGKQLYTIAAEKTSKLDRWIETASEWFSSILVKEVRQSLKSRFFVWPFFTLLLVVLVWSLGAIGISMYNGALNQAGPILLCGFLDILGFPLAIIIPYAAFRSLVHEFEDGTLQLVSITTLRPYQIISGKLVSAMLQIMIYISILAPCIVFTYLLRGVDILQILLALAAAMLGSVCLCVIALFLASSSRQRAVGIFASLVLLALLVWTFVTWCVLSYGISFEMDSAPMEDPEVQCVIYGMVMIVVTWAVVMFAAACANISFPTENRSTLIRIALLVQQTVFFGWFLSMMITFSYLDEGMIYTSAGYMLMHWLVIGAMMCCVGDGMSRKVRRGLPKTTFGQFFLSLLQPGPGRGFLFAIANIWATIIFIAFAMLLAEALPASFAVNNSNIQLDEILAFLFVTGVYTTFYLCVLFLFLNAMPAVRAKSGPMFGLLIAILFIPLVMLSLPLLQLLLNPSARGYTLWHFLNGFWTAVEVSDGEPIAVVALMFISLSTLVLGGFALMIAGRELKERVESVPERVQKEIDSGKTAARALPVGESIDEIFGPLDHSKDHSQGSRKDHNKDRPNN